MFADFIKKLTVPLFLALLMAVGFRFTEWTGLDNAFLGIHPRDFSQWWGIATVPLVHGSIGHLMGNLLAFSVLSAFLFIVYEKIATRVMIWLWLVTGLFMFLFARGEFYHIGASGVVYALIMFLIVAGFLNRTRTPMVIAVIVAFYYGGSIWGVFPLEKQVSWDGHLSGAAAGILAALIFNRYIGQLYPKVTLPEWFEENDKEDDWYSGFDADK